MSARGRADPRPTTPAGLVLAETAVGLSLRSRPALPHPPPHSDQPWALADWGRAVKHQEQLILGVHLRGLDGMCVGCRAWWARLAPYPCWQVEWATSRQARSLTAALLGGRA
ncbi:hypothetical protein ACGFI9_29315 [Micromonospora sp. NPDC048930]|uniref:hypothetical protein n=1 Tax=Micromonospora sp. NPDC048930 TaxID=3364261 RepID=UPI003711553D